MSKSSLPESWCILPLKMVSKIITKGTTPTTYGYQYTDGGIKFIRVENLTENGQIETGNQLYIDDVTHRYLSRSQLEEEDVLISIAGTIGRTAIIGKKDLPANTNQALALIRLDKNLANPKYIRYFLASEVGQKSIFSQSVQLAQANLSLSQIALTSIFLPSLDEQKEIAEILDTADAAIQQTEAVIAKLKQVKAGLLHDLLTRGLDENGHLRDPEARPEQFKEVEGYGRVPKEWEVVQIGEVAQLQGGFAFSSRLAVDQGVRWLKIANVGQGMADWKEKSFLPFGLLRNQPEFELKPNDIVVAMTRPVLNGVLKISKLTKNDTPALLNQRVGRFLLSDRLNTGFLYALMRLDIVARNIEAVIFGTDPPNISSKQIEAIYMPLPNLVEQERIIEVLDAQDNLIRAEEAYRDKLHLIKQGLMQDLLTGKVRV